MNVLLTSLALMALCTICRAEVPAAYEDAMSALAAEEIQCGVFWNIVGICFVTPNGDKSTSERAMVARDKMFDRAVKSTTEAKLLPATIDARHKHSQESMMAKIGKDCRNISILLADHGEACKKLAEDPTLRTIELLREQLGMSK